MSAPTRERLLTRREVACLVLIAQGLTHQQIANEWFVTVDTARKHTFGIRRALGVNNMAHAVARAYELGILPVRGA